MNHSACYGINKGLIVTKKDEALERVNGSELALTAFNARNHTRLRLETLPARAQNGSSNVGKFTSGSRSEVIQLGHASLLLISTSPSWCLVCRIFRPDPFFSIRELLSASSV